MAKIMKGAEVTAALNEELKNRVAALADKKVTPTLAVLRVGEREDDISYEKGVLKRCDGIGVTVKRFLLPADVSQDKLLEVIEEINQDQTIHGCLIFRPLPKHLDDQAVRQALKPEKDVDGITDGSLAGVFTGSGEGFPPCTAQACIEILDHFQIPLKGKRVTVIGRSLVVGKPLAMMLLARHATITVCHTRTVDMADRCREAEIICAAAGVANMVTKDFLSSGQVVIDVGINFTPEGKLVGDVDFAAAEAIVDAITPVPGGVGTVTTSVLAKHVIMAAERTLA